jgi:hypothetical protein
MDLLDFDLVVYDEIQHFSDWNHALFDYPFSSRKTNLQTI